MGRVSEMASDGLRWDPVGLQIFAGRRAVAAPFWRTMKSPIVLRSLAAVASYAAY